MNGPHQPGWSDEELIALRDLRFSTRAPKPEGTPRRQSGAPSRSNEAARRAEPPRRTEPARRNDTARQAESPRSRSTANPSGRFGSASTSAGDARYAPLREHRPPAKRAPEPQRREINLWSFLPGGDRMRSFQELRQEMMNPVENASIGVFSRKGGVGKTTITAYLGLMLARVRRGPVVAIDGDPEAGSLGWMLAPEGACTLEALAASPHTPQTFDEFMPFITETSEGLDLILGDTSETGPVDERGLNKALAGLRRSYDLSLYDTGSGVAHTVGRTLINNSRVLLLVMGPSVDSVRAAERSLAWLDDRHDSGTPPTEVIAVINGIPSNMRESQIEHIEDLFADRCAGVVRIPWDEHLAAGSATASVQMLARPTQLAFMELAATVVDLLARPTRSSHRNGRHAVR